MSKWHAANICIVCWDKTHINPPVVTITSEGESICCYCGKNNYDYVFIRDDAEVLRCSHYITSNDICDFLDLKNLDHLRAYKDMLETGEWPSKFLPDNISFRPSWRIYISNYIVDLYLKEKLNA